ncbi:MAG: response regulator [Lachnospiraceae bacterium]|nr:response regulator [Lachnospiraceae bacterium]MDE6698807.1 response regulator [Lachnospiraceae bacterium]
MEKKTVLIADDAEINRDILNYIFEGTFNIIMAVDGEEAISKIEENKEKLSLVFLDLMMPKKSGLDVLEYMNDKDLIDIIPVIMITGEATAESDEKAYEYGASDIIYKPFAPRVVMRRTTNIIELFEHRIDVERQLEERTRELIESREKLEKSNDFLVNALSSVVEFRSLESGDHIKRVKEFTKILLNYIRKHFPEYKLTKEQVDLIVNASALHDVGKIAIPDSILLKPGRFTPEEFEEMKKHTIYGCELLEKFNQEENEFYRYCYDICRYHHERYDGKGYPDGLSGDEIPIWAQVVSIVDVYDALISKRCYKDAYGIEEAIRMINAGECGTFSPKLLECFELAKDEIIANTQNIMN